MRDCFDPTGDAISEVDSVQQAATLLQERAYDFLFIDNALASANGSISLLLEHNPWMQLVVIAGPEGADQIRNNGNGWEADYLVKPVDANQILYVTRRAVERSRVEKKLGALQAATSDGDSDLPAVDTAMRSVLTLAHRVARTQATLVMQGETGTGKARLAHAIHIWSDRADSPFGTVICQSDDADNIETELFGIPTAGGPPAGLVELCEGGTLVLQEISELPMRLQPAILRLLEDQEFERPDESTRRRCDVRIIATTTVDLEKAVAEGTFRADLLMAINVVQLDIPPLRERKDDIPHLAEQYLAFFGRRLHRPPLSLSREALHVLTEYRWPGNVRELRNVLERAAILCTGDTVGVSHLPSNLLNSKLDVTVGDLIPLATVEEAHIRRVVKTAKSLRQAATILGIDSGTVVRKMRRYSENDEAPISS